MPREHGRSWKAQLLVGLGAMSLVALGGCASGIGGGDFVIPDFHVFFTLEGVDLDGHGHARLAVADGFHQNSGRTFSVALLSGGSTPSLSARLVQPWMPTGLAFGDVDGDGLADLVVLDTDTYQANRLSIHLQDSAHPGQFLTPKVITLPQGDEWVRLADLNSDGCLDILTDIGHPVALIQEPAHRGNFGAPIDLGFPRGKVVCCDLNGDGLTDVAVATIQGSLQTFLQPAPGGIWQAGPSFALGGQPAGFTAGDLDGDGAQDLVVAVVTATGPSRGYLIAYLHDPGAGASFHATFTGLSFTGGLGWQGLVCTDLNGDGKADLAYTQTGSGAVTVSLQLPGPTVSFSPTSSFGGFSNLGALRAFDLDQDGRKDLLVAADRLCLLRQDPQHPGSFLPPAQLLP